MQRRAVIALALAAASLLLALGFGVMTFVCGASEQGESSDSSGNTTTYGPRCVSALHPFAGLWAGLALAGGVGLILGRAWPAIAFGGIGLAFGILGGFSAGLFGIGCGALLLAAGLVGRKPRPSSIAR